MKAVLLVNLMEVTQLPKANRPLLESDNLCWHDVHMCTGYEVKLKSWIEPQQIVRAHRLWNTFYPDSKAKLDSGPDQLTPYADSVLHLYGQLVKSSTQPGASNNDIDDDIDVEPKV